MDLAECPPGAAHRADTAGRPGVSAGGAGTLYGLQAAAPARSEEPQRSGLSPVANRHQAFPLYGGELSAGTSQEVVERLARPAGCTGRSARSGRSAGDAARACGASAGGTFALAEAHCRGAAAIAEFVPSENA